MDRDDIKMLVAKWWEIYDDKSLDFKADAAQEGESIAFMKDSSMMAAILDPKLTYLAAPSAA